MCRDQNPGLARRFNASVPVRFEDYTDDELGCILTEECTRLGLVAPLAVKQHLVLRKLRPLRSLPNFGNAGAVHTMLADAKARMALRLQVVCHVQAPMSLAHPHVCGTCTSQRSDLAPLPTVRLFSYS